MDLSEKNIVAEGPGYIGGNQQSSLTWEHELVSSPRRNKQRGISLTKTIWSSSCFMLLQLQPSQPPSVHSREITEGK